MNKYDDAGKLILRLTLGILILLHGIAKMTNGISGVMNLVAQQGWPTFVAYGVYIGEVVAPVLLIVGLFTRLAGLIVAANMAAACLLAHSSQWFDLGRTGGWQLELQGMFFFSAIAVALLGAGRYSVGGVGGRWN